MIDEPQILQTDARRTAVIRLTVPRAEIRNVMGPAITDVIEVVSRQGIGPAGPVCSRHFRQPTDVFDLEIGVPISGDLKPEGRVVASELPAVRVARTIYRGPYEGLGDAWGEFDAWMKAHGHAAGEGLWECYVMGPESAADPADWRTELNRPLA